MTSSSAANSWISVHLFFSGEAYSAFADEIALSTVEPLVRACEREDLIDRWFFIRYRERGPHFRLRVQAKASQCAGDVQAKLAKLIQLRHPAAYEGFPDESLIQMRPVTDPSGCADVIAFAWVPYEPEIARYGGPEATLVAEDCFGWSSDFSMKCLRTMRSGGRPQRLGRAMIAMLTSAQVFFESRQHVVRFISAYGDGYLRSLVANDRRHLWIDKFDGGFDQQATSLVSFVADVWERLDANEPLTSELDMFRNQLGLVREKLTHLAATGKVLVRGEVSSYEVSAGAIVPSYIHMTNNRLGITVYEEAYLARLMERALTSKSGAASLVNVYDDC